MALDLGLTTYQLLSALDGLAPNIQSRRRRLDEAIDRALAASADDTAFRTAAVGRRPYIAARTGPEGLLGSQPPPEVPQDWTALSVDGSHIDVDRHLPLRCHLINLGGCAITYGASYGCQLFNEPTLAVDDADLYLRAPNGARGETLIAGPLLGALRTVREVERLADAVENLPDDRPVLALLDGTLAFWDLQRGNYPRYVADVLIAERLQPALARLRAASTNRRPVAVAAYTSRPRTTEVAGALRLMLCEQADGDCNRLCTARHSDLASCGGAAGFPESKAGLPASSAALPARTPPVRSTFAEGDRRLLQCLPSLDGRRLIPSGLGRVQPERRPPQPRQWIWVGSGDTGPGLLLWLPVGGGPVFPGRRRHGRCGSQQLPQPRYLPVRRRTVLAGPTTRQCPFAVPYGRPGQLRPGPSVRFPQLRNAGSGHWLTPRSLFLPKSDDILTNPSH